MILCFADCEFDTDRHTLSRGGALVAIEPQVFDLIRLLLENPDRLVTRDEIVEVVWGGRIVSESAISARIASARKAVGDDGQRLAVIRTVQRRGLQMAVPVKGNATGPPSPQSPVVPNIRYTKNATGQAIAFAISGDGPPVLRTYPASHLEAEWRASRERAMVELVCRGNRMLRYDYIGSGMSDQKLEQVDFDESAEDLRAVADAAGFESFTLYSESGGVHAALRFAARYPQRVIRLAILGGYVDGRSRRGLAPHPDFLREIMTDENGGNVPSIDRVFALAYFPDGPLEEVYEHAKIFRAAYNHQIQLIYRDAINSVSNADLLGKIQCPTLIIHGRHDPVHPLSEAQKLAAGIPDAELLVLETANHLPLPGHSTWSTFAPAFRQFLDGN